MHDEEDTQLDRPWVIKKAGGQMYSCPDVGALKKWIAEGRLRRDDQISNRGDRWFRLGDSPELARAFDKIEIARTHRAGVTGHRMARHRRLSDETLEGIVNSFTTKRRARTAILSVAGATLAVAAIGASYAMLGPKPNPLRTFLEDRGVLPGRVLAEKAFAHHTSIAYAAWARGDITDHVRAEQTLEKAAALQKDSGEVAANLALVYASHADALKRVAADEERDAEKMIGEEQEKLQKTAAERRTRAGEMIIRAREYALQAERLAPEGTPTFRALAEVGRVGGDQAREQNAIAALEKKLATPGQEDAWSYAVLARAAAPDPESADTAANELAAQRLRRAIELEPGLDRARVHLARIYAARGSLTDAENELNTVLGSMPSYEEAQRLMGHVRAEIAQGEQPAAEETGA